MLLMSRREMLVGAGAFGRRKFDDERSAATLPNHMLRVIVPRAPGEILVDGSLMARIALARPTL
jgi:hypothetical protein